MASHHCRTYPQDPYCSCYNQAGEPQYHYKQFDTLGQTYNCCDQITASLNQLDDILEEGDTTITENAKDFFKKLYEKKITGCQFQKYFKDPSTNKEDDVYFMENYKDLYDNFITIQALYNQFILNKQRPKHQNNYVTCDEDGYYPYILSYKSPGQIYDNYSYICSKNTNDVFSPLATSYGKIDFNIRRFYDNSTGKPCTKKSCQLISSDNLNNFGDVINQGNSQPVYRNKKNTQKNGLIASSVLSLLFFCIGIYIFWKFHTKMKKLENISS